MMVHEDKMVGLQMSGNVKFTSKTNCDGGLYWQATQPIGSLFGTSVEGECVGYGITPEIAFTNLEKDIVNLYEGLWM